MVVVDKRLMNADEASYYLGIGKTKLYSWMKRGKVPFLKIDNATRFDVNELDELVEKLKTER